MTDMKYYLDLEYTVLVRENENGGFFVELAELPGCWAEGATEQEARETLNDAKRLWIRTQIEDGQQVPLPRKGAQNVVQFPSPITVDYVSTISNETSQKVFSDVMWTHDYAKSASDFIIAGHVKSSPAPSV